MKTIIPFGLVSTRPAQQESAGLFRGFARFDAAGHSIELHVLLIEVQVHDGLLRAVDPEYRAEVANYRSEYGADPATITIDGKEFFAHITPFSS